MAHLDIKPENIFYVYDDNNRQSRTGNPFHMTFKLGDFGLTKTMLEERQFWINIEARDTGRYMGPEMDYSNRPSFDARLADVYSLGVTLARSILGSYDFSTYIADLHGHMLLAQNRSTSKLNMSPEAATLITAMLNPENLMRSPVPVILQQFEWTTTNVVNRRRVRSALSPSRSTMPLWHQYY